MSRKPQDPQYIADIFKLTLPELQVKYRKKGNLTQPTIKNQASLNVLRHKYRKELKNMNHESAPNESAPNPEQDRLQKIADLLHRSGIDPQDVERVERANVWQGFIRNNEGEIEYADLASVSFIPKQNESEASFISQAAPVTIHSLERQAPDREHRLIFVFGDAQIAYRRINEEYIPIHDERAMSVARIMCHDLQPETIVNLGDTVDLPQLSKYDPDSNHFLSTLQLAFDRAHRLYAELRADNPTSEIHEVDSNHNARLGHFVTKKAMEFYGLRQAGMPPDSWPVLSYAFLANLDALDVNWHSGYDAAAYHYADDLMFIHGKEVRSNGSTAELLSKKYPYTSVVAGHGHKAQTHVRTTPEGKYLTAAQVGALCDTLGLVPGYGSAVDDRGNPVRKQQDWTQGVMVISDYGNGNYQFDHVYINDGKAYYNGKEYSADE